MPNKYHWDIATIVKNSDLKRFIREHEDDMEKDDWYDIYKSDYFSLDLLELYPNDLPWGACCLFKKMPQTLMEKYPEKLDWYAVSSFQVYNKAFIDKFVHRMSLPQIVKNEKLPKDVREYGRKLMEKYNDPEHHKVWDENLGKCRAIRPKNFTGKYNDYTDKTPLAYEKYEKKKSSTTNAKSSTKAKNTPKQKNIVNLDYEKMTKTELKDILAKRCVKVMYHDTMPILIQKCKDSEEK